MEPSVENDTTLTMENRHRKEKKELQAQIQALKKTAKNDKSKKKEILSEIAKLEIEMDSRHKEELKSLQLETNQTEKHTSENQNSVEQEVAKMKISKAQKRRDKKSLLEKEREESIKLQEKENLHGPRNQEIQEISAKLKLKKLKIFSIPSDGDCLFNAVAHQLLTIRKEVYTAEQLRKVCASYMRENIDDFLPFMTNPDTYEMLTVEEFNNYCDKIVNTNMWGGQLEIRALSSTIKCPITVIQATGPDCIEQGGEFSGPPLVITYHRHMYRLGEHYNSTCLYDEEEVE
ncbi:unnamed protein product [Diatraea saccharalis]|uniref:OTU domain-containing protein n=1 Tax=Diatraea saccharalis TaxID=40085 RepID=A0A9N9QVP9_9NEOP|nr:unnamed protein product [Diatraea saccharalis]